MDEARRLREKSPEPPLTHNLIEVGPGLRPYYPTLNIEPYVARRAPAYLPREANMRFKSARPG